MAIPAGTKEDPLPRVLALMPGVHLEAETATEYRWGDAPLAGLYVWTAADQYSSY